ncbi:aminophospholipid translocase that localizes primarily to the plasma membrane [Ascoidea rubescens DSM 1968]|uniref:Phospholipid-transporting ATPase n=1 Tax=Ascoidea rubescens DSM 1968 TaxID=1344418 RepID=A0A1D2VPV7_9ASCO|nr:aminophospholipid translocase that localizes primarily to the plasma membrane [Ascoidea rubescens DSM 1968]ODV63577.1 aminophospholipid translocase that localizes primarily to the plasma membrane [Ascoidea rubescens DSM 1968]
MLFKPKSETNGIIAPSPNLEKITLNNDNNLTHKSINGDSTSDNFNQTLVKNEIQNHQLHLSIKDKLHLFFYNHFPDVDPPQFLKDQFAKETRNIYVNIPLPNNMKDPKTGFPLKNYPRNKIRTTRYTPVTFLPKNLILQFSNIANIYFLLMIILGAFEVFGVENPVLNSVPLIVIVCLTAIKDAIEDYRRASSDVDLNNSRIHLLTGLPNPNVIISNISLWRKFKKLNTRILRFFLKAVKYFFVRKNLNKNNNQNYWSDRASIQSTIVPTQTQLQTPRNSLSIIARTRTSISVFPNSKKITDPLPNTIINPNVQPNGLSKFKNKNWKDILVGDIIRVRQNEEVPADIVLLTSSNEEGTCFIETKNLDGETNLKQRNSLKAGSGIKYSNDCERIQCWIECEAPNTHLYQFKGLLHYNDNTDSSQLSNLDPLQMNSSEPITNSNVLLRGCTLRNTKWALGIVVYTGSETKIVLNSGVTPLKKSRISKELNLSVFINFMLLFVMCFVSGIVNGIFYADDTTSRIFYEFEAWGSTSAINGILGFFVAVNLYQTLVPISLYISIEIIKTVQAIFIYSDVKMYYDKLDYPCVPKSWNISDDLGQIEYIFSDKTGTLTQNVMEFKKCSINTKSYGLCYTEAKMGMQKRLNVDVLEEKSKMKNIIHNDHLKMLQLIEESKQDNGLFKSTDIVDDELTFISSQYVSDVLNTNQYDPQKIANDWFMTCMALCHSVVTEDDPDSNRKLLKAESPDEAALVGCARDVGIEFTSRFRDSIQIKKYGDAKSYKILSVIPFSSSRKKMSIILEIPADELPSFMNKGADNVIYERLKEDSDEEIVQRTAIHLEEFAKEGLRTLCFGYKEISESEFSAWFKRSEEAAASISDDREENIERVSSEIENDLNLIGCTAIEDRLQDGVPDSIQLLAEAGIKLWVLTGDKIETAINIGFSCNLLESDMKLLVIKPELNDNSPDKGLNATISSYLSENFHMQGTQEELELAKLDHFPPKGRHAVVVDGSALTTIFNLHTGSEDLQRNFLLLCKQCKSVLCCRVSPSQKAEVVKLVKNSLEVMTLAIGDGANDVAMIQAANVGIGIAGEEGRQAVMSSDYGLGQFRFLTRLVLVHGRWSYKRLAEMIPCFFYKNVVFTFTLFWFCVFNNFDGSYLYEFTFLMFFNLAFTSLPVIFLGVLDQDVSDTISLLVPQLYRTGILRLEWSQFKFIYYMCDGLYQSILSFFFPYLLYYQGILVSDNGLNIHHRFWMGVMVANIAVISCNIYVLMRQYRWDWLSVLIDILSCLFIFFWTGVWSAGTISGPFYKVAPQIFGSPAFWCVFFIGVIANLLPRFVYDTLNKLYHPRDIDIIRERVQKGAFSQYPKHGYDPTCSEDVDKYLENANIPKDREHISLTLDTPVSGHSDHSDHSDHSNHSYHSHHLHLSPTSPTSPNSDGTNRKRSEMERVKGVSPLNRLRLKMIETGEYTPSSSRNSLERIQSTHEVPGLSQAESLVNIHSKRHSMLTMN